MLHLVFCCSFDFIIALFPPFAADFCYAKQKRAFHRVFVVQFFPCYFLSFGHCVSCGSTQGLNDFTTAAPNPIWREKCWIVDTESDSDVGYKRGSGWPHPSFARHGFVVEIVLICLHAFEWHRSIWNERKCGKLFEIPLCSALLSVDGDFIRYFFPFETIRFHGILRLEDSKSDSFERSQKWTFRSRREACAVEEQRSQTSVIVLDLLKMPDVSAFDADVAVVIVVVIKLHQSGTHSTPRVIYRTLASQQQSAKLFRECVFGVSASIQGSTSSTCKHSQLLLLCLFARGPKNKFTLQNIFRLCARVTVLPNPPSARIRPPSSASYFRPTFRIVLKPI